MRRTIHLVQRGLPPPLRCLACGEIAEIGQSASLHSPTICYNRSDWDTIYRNHNDYRRCIDNPDARDRPSLQQYSAPSEPGFYWAEWRIVEDGTWAPDVKEDDILYQPCTYPIVVQVSQTYDEDNHLIAEVPGVEKEQPLDNFVWRSGKLKLEG